MGGTPQRAGGEGEPRYLTVGVVRKPHGIKGELFIWLETDQPDKVFRPGRSLLVGDAAGRPTDRSLTVERSRLFKGGLLLQPEGHRTRTEETESLRGCSLLIPEAEAEPLGEGEVFYHQLIGMQVVADGAPVGTVREVYEAPSGDLLVVRRQGGDEVLIPFVRDLIRAIQPETRVLEIDPPAGLLDL
jgi:16S rRNA processing protein RimM